MENCYIDLGPYDFALSLGSPFKDKNIMSLILYIDNGYGIYSSFRRQTPDYGYKIYRIPRGWLNRHNQDCAGDNHLNARVMTLCLL
jgi:hypothetical protein